MIGEMGEPVSDEPIPYTLPYTGTLPRGTPTHTLLLQCIRVGRALYGLEGVWYLSMGSISHPICLLVTHTMQGTLLSPIGDMVWVAYGHVLEVNPYPV